jgi:hypothetical protein
MHPLLRLYEDVLQGGAAQIELPPAPRMIFVVHGAMTVEGKSISDGETWNGEDEVMVDPGPRGVTCWRFELAPAGSGSAALAGGNIRSQQKLAATLETVPKGELLLRGDSVAFPPGGCAFLHRHQGPGIRCLIEGGIRIDTKGHSTSYGPGGAWYESGPEPVFAQGARDRASRFIRMMILPRALIGKSSIEYLNAEDKERPKSQSYKGFADAPIGFPAPRL